MNYIIHHGTDGTEGTIIGYAEDMGVALLEVKRILGNVDIPPLNRACGEVMFNFMRDNRSEWIRIRTFYTYSVGKAGKLYGDIKPHHDYSLFV